MENQGQMMRTMIVEKRMMIVMMTVTMIAAMKTAMKMKTKTIMM